MILGPRACDWAEMPSPGPKGRSSNSRGGVEKTTLAAPLRKTRASRSAARLGPKPIGTSTAITFTSANSSKSQSIRGISSSRRKRPCSRTTATQPPLVPSTPATRTRLSVGEPGRFDRPPREVLVDLPRQAADADSADAGLAVEYRDAALEEG